MKCESCLVALVSLFAVGCGHAVFRTYIPNGNNVPDPCTQSTGDVWYWVGHVNVPWLTMGRLNPFGEDFKAIRIELLGKNNLIWPRLCPLDSDNDGRTNGEELGDKNCTWTKGQNEGWIPDTPRITHPGIKELNDGSMEEKIRLKYCS